MTGPVRRRVLISAYACGPVEEPEASAGWAFALAAAEHAEVWVLTRRRFEAPVAAALAADPELAARLHFVHLDLSDRVRSFWRHDWDLYWYYALWQRKAAGIARALHAEHDFAVAHHVTFANDWLPCGVAGLAGVPLVWGPIGGASQLPYWRLRPWLGARGVATELIRDAVTAVPRALWGDSTARRAALVVAQNADVAQRFARHAQVVVEPNAALDQIELDQVALEAGTADRPRPDADAARPAQRTAVYAGRLIALKGVRLALDALALAPDWRLLVYGDGYERAGLQRRAERLGIAGRVEFLGHRPRAEVLAAFATADAMLFPSMHDQAGWAVAEASSLGCPVVCLPLGGPPLLAEPNDFVAGLDGDIVANVAEQLRLAGAARGRRHDRWSKDRLPELVAGWYDRAERATRLKPR